MVKGPRLPGRRSPARPREPGAPHVEARVSNASWQGTPLLARPSTVLEPVPPAGRWPGDCNRASGGGV